MKNDFYIKCSAWGVEFSLFVKHEELKSRSVESLGANDSIYNEFLLNSLVKELIKNFHGLPAFEYIEVVYTPDVAATNSMEHTSVEHTSVEHTSMEHKPLIVSGINCVLIASPDLSLEIVDHLRVKPLKLPKLNPIVFESEFTYAGVEYKLTTEEYLVSKTDKRHKDHAFYLAVEVIFSGYSVNALIPAAIIQKVAADRFEKMLKLPVIELELLKDFAEIALAEIRLAIPSIIGYNIGTWHFLDTSRDYVGCPLSVMGKSSGTVLLELRHELLNLGSYKVEETSWIANHDDNQINVGIYVGAVSLTVDELSHLTKGDVILLDNYLSNGVNDIKELIVDFGSRTVIADVTDDRNISLTNRQY